MEIEEDKRILFFFIIQLIALGGAIEGFGSHSLRLATLWDWINPVLLIYFIIITKCKFIKLRNLLIAIAFLFFWQILLILKYGSYPILLGRIYDVLYAFILIRAISIDDFFYYTEKSVVILTKIGLLLWIPIVIFPDIRYLYEQFCLEPHTPWTCQGTFGFFSFAAFGKDGEGITVRNLGFAREPGVYSCIVVFTLMIHLIRTKFVLFQKNFWPLLLGLFSSQSTTGYMAFFICVLGFFINASYSVSVRKIKIVIAILSFLTLVYSPFMVDKIEEISDSDNFLNDVKAQNYSDAGWSYVPQRIEGLVLESMNIMHSPLVGYGDNDLFSYVKSTLFPNFDIALSNGLLQIIAMMGIPLGLLVYFLTYKSSSKIIQYYNLKGNYLLFLLICAINVSYNFFVQPFFVVFTLYSFFVLDEEITDESEMDEIEKCEELVDLDNHIS